MGKSIVAPKVAEGGQCLLYGAQPSIAIIERFIWLARRPRVAPAIVVHQRLIHIQLCCVVRWTRLENHVVGMIVSPAPIIAVCYLKSR